MGTKRTAILAAAAGLVALAVVACSGDDSSGGDTSDAGRADSAPPGDSAPPSDSSPPADAGGDAGCDFNAFVTGLITNHTNATDLPSTDLGESCVDTHTALPQSLFQ